MLAELRDAVADAKARHPEIVRVLLCGSLVRGDWTADSDADLIVVTRRDFHGLAERARYQIFINSMPTDTLVYSEREFEDLARDPAGFLAGELSSALDL